METLHIIILSLIQGFTEFLPISSSAHLILPSLLLGWPDQGLAFDVATHVGTLLAVILYFRVDIVQLTKGWINTGFSATPNHHAKLSWSIVIATIPAVIIGLLSKDFIEENLRSMMVIAITTVLFGILLALSDRLGQKKKELIHMTFMAALIIGLFQALALIPGTSRSGITITAALFLGFQRTSAAHFSFLISIPLIFAAGTLETLELIQSSAKVNWMELGLGVVLSFLSAYICIYLFLSLISKIGMMPFVLYRLVLGAVLFCVLI
jgi:undecaprenyl-diphosphatase